MRIAAVLPLAAAAALAASPAAADGLPVLGVDVGGEGVAVAASHRYVTFTLDGETVVARVEQDGGRVAAFTTLRGRYTIPAVAYDGSAAGLSGDRGTLVLVRPRATFPQARTRFAVVAAPRLRLREVVDLDGDFSFDAISPDGRWLYLVEYPSPRDPTLYLVRLYDLARDVLLSEPIIDPREVGDVMRGQPVTRASSGDGRWAYTLYDGAGGHPFVHALDTVGRTARCIDLHDLEGQEGIMDFRLAAPGDVLDVLTPSLEVAARIDTRTFELLPLEDAHEQPVEDDTESAAASAAAPSPDHWSWPLVTLAVPVAAALGAVVAAGRSRRRARGAA